jgi:hypothetical protein
MASITAFVYYGRNKDQDVFSGGLKLPAAKVRLERTEPMTVFTAAEASNEWANASVRNILEHCVAKEEGKDQELCNVTKIKLVLRGLPWTFQKPEF